MTNYFAYYQITFRRQEQKNIVIAITLIKNLSSSRKFRYNVSFDNLLSERKEVYIKRYNILLFVYLRKEEKEYE